MSYYVFPIGILRDPALASRAFLRHRGLRWDEEKSLKANFVVKSDVRRAPHVLKDQGVETAGEPHII